MKVSLFQLNKLGNELNKIQDKFYEEDICISPAVQIGPDDDNDFIWDSCIEYKNGKLIISGNDTPSGCGHEIVINVSFTKNSMKITIVKGNEFVDLGYLALKEVFINYTNEDQIPFIKQLLNL